MSTATLGGLDREIARIYEEVSDPAERVRRAEQPLRAFLRDTVLPIDAYGARSTNLYARYRLNAPELPIQVVLAIWNPGSDSPMHNHQHLTGVVTLLTGRLMETKYDLAPDGDAWRVVAEAPTEMQCGAFSPIYPEGIEQVHRMFNPGDETAATLHVYFGHLTRLDRYLPMPDGRLRAEPRDLWFDPA